MILPPPRSTLFPTRRSSDLSSVYNSVKGKKERVGRMVQMHANDREEIKEVLAGDIAAAIGLKNVTTGDTLCDENHKIVLERMEFPRSEEHTSELQSRPHLVCRLLLE